MSGYGFVYCLGNECMPGIYKVGCTERSPRERAEELSKSTSVPLPFKVLFYIEIRDFQTVEARLHGWLSENRVSGNREFFKCDLAVLARIFYFHPDRVSFCDATEHAESDGPQEWYSVTDHDGCIDGWLDCPSSMWNPFDKRKVQPSEPEFPEPAVPDQPSLRVVGGTEIDNQVDDARGVA